MPIVTTIEPGKTFYPAEDYHQDYLARHPHAPYIVINDLPKIDDLKHLFPRAVSGGPAARFTPTLGPSSVARGSRISASSRDDAIVVAPIESRTVASLHTDRPKALWLLLGLAASLLLVVFALESIWGGGHPPLSAVLLLWGLYPTLTWYLSRALLGSEFPSPLLMLVGLLEYALVGVGLASLIARSRGRVVTGARTAIVAVFIYISAQFTAHLLLNLPSVNLRLLADVNPAVSIAAANRIRDAGDAAAVPALQQKLVEDFNRDGRLEAGLLDALTVLGGARGWQDLLDSGRLGVAGPAARAWRFIVRERAGDGQSAVCRGAWWRPKP